MAWKSTALRCALASWFVSGCATYADVTAANPPSSAHNVDDTGTLDTRPVDAGAIVAATTSTPPHKPIQLLVHEGCRARINLVRSAPITFEGDVASGVREVEVEVEGPAGLVVGIEGAGTPLPLWSAVQLTPKVALQLPAGPARDGPAGVSGALFDIGGLAAAGFGNLIALPFSVPLALLTNSNDLFFFEAPSFKDGMFVDVVLDERAWGDEVARRAAPHAGVLEIEAKRQQRFAAFRDRLSAAAAPVSCAVDDTGHCQLRFTWPTSAMTVRFTGPTCPPIPKIADKNGKPVPAFSADEYYAPTAALPALPAPPKPQLLPVAHNPDERRGRGARATADAWSATTSRLDDPRNAFARAKHRGAPNMPLSDATLVCQLKARGSFDADGSSPDLVVRLVWGFDRDVVGVTFDEVSAWTTTFGLAHATILPGELVKISVVDVDAFVDDWIGMDIVTFEGTLPLRFKTRSFSAECRADD